MCVSPAGAAAAAAAVPSKCDEGWRPLATLHQSQSVQHDDDDDEYGGVEDGDGEEDDHHDLDDDVVLATITVEANIVFSSFANSVFQSFVIKRIKRFAAGRYKVSLLFFCVGQP